MANKKEIEDLKIAIQNQLTQEFAASYFFAEQGLAERKRALMERIKELIEPQERNRQTPVLSAAEKETLIKGVVDEILGFGIIDDLMKDETVTEILINGPDKVYVEKGGRKFRAEIRFRDVHQLDHLVQKLVSHSGRKVDETTPYVDASLEEGSRLNVIIPPLSLGGPVVTIRKFSKHLTRIEDLVRIGTLSKEAGEFLVACVRGRINLIFSGPTGVGKTTTLGVLTYYILPEERIVVIEDTIELTFHQEHVVRLQARLPNIEGKGEVTIRALLRNAMRMRPERIVIGEIRGGEALDMLQAMASGHNGALGVIHAASPSDVISRMETMIATSEVNIPLWAIRKYIASNLSLIIQQERLLDGSRKVTNITEVRGIENGEFVLADIFLFEQEGLAKDGTVLGQMRPSGIKPLFLSKLEKQGIVLDAQLFNKG